MRNNNSHDRDDGDDDEDPDRGGGGGGGRHGVGGGGDRWDTAATKAVVSQRETGKLWETAGRLLRDTFDTADIAHGHKRAIRLALRQGMTPSQRKALDGERSLEKDKAHRDESRYFRILFRCAFQEDWGLRKKIGSPASQAEPRREAAEEEEEEDARASSMPASTHSSHRSKTPTAGGGAGSLATAAAALAPTGWIYVLLLMGGFRYVGFTKNPSARHMSHLGSHKKGSTWTTDHPLDESVDNGWGPGIEMMRPVNGALHGYDEDHETLEQMSKHSIETVRGGTFVCPTLDAGIKLTIKRMMRHAEQKCLACGDPNHWAKDCTPMLATAAATAQAAEEQAALAHASLAQAAAMQVAQEQAAQAEAAAAEAALAHAAAMQNARERTSEAEAAAAKAAQAETARSGRHLPSAQAPTRKVRRMLPQHTSPAAKATQAETARSGQRLPSAQAPKVRHMLTQHTRPTTPIS